MRRFFRSYIEAMGDIIIMVPLGSWFLYGAFNGDIVAHWKVLLLVSVLFELLTIITYFVCYKVDK